VVRDINKNALSPRSVSGTMSTLLDIVVSTYKMHCQCTIGHPLACVCCVEIEVVRSDIVAVLGSVPALAITMHVPQDQIQNQLQSVGEEKINQYPRNIFREKKNTETFALPLGSTSRSN
jgi:hypothetical protein